LGVSPVWDVKEVYRVVKGIDIFSLRMKLSIFGFSELASHRLFNVVNIPLLKCPT
jgi:hypothetical protein